MNMIGGFPIRAKVLLLAGVPIIGTFVLALVIAQHARTQTQAADALGSIEDVAKLSVHISDLMQALQVERARSALLEGYAERNPAPDLEGDLERERRATDQAMQRLERFLTRHDLSALPSRLARDLARARTQARKRRSFAAQLSADPVAIQELLDFYNSACDDLINSTAALTELSDDGELLRTISSLVALSYLAERASREHALLSYVFAAGEFPPGAFKLLVTLSTEHDVYESTFRSGVHGHEADQFDRVQQLPTVLRAKAMRQEALGSLSDDLYEDARAWFEAAGGELSALHGVEQALLRKITYAATAKLAATRASVHFGWWLSIAVVLVSGTLASLIARGVTRSIVDLSRAAAHVRQTNDFSVRVRKTSQDELGALTETFNDMLAMVEQRDRHLESQVAERTEELRRTLAELWSEMDLATKIQTVLLPQEPRLPAYEVCAKMVPATRVGGDYYDVFTADGCDWILIGDVSGHGVTAGLTMMLVQSAVKTVLSSAGSRAREITPKQLLAHVNAAVRDSMQKISSDQYMTIMALKLDGGCVTYAGLHQDVLVYRATAKKVERITTRGIWVGLLDDITDLLDDDTFEMNDGDVLMLYTDGVTEISIDSSLLGTDGVAAMLEHLADRAPELGSMVEQVTRNVCVATQDDDVTVLLARYQGSKAITAASNVA